MEISPAGVTRQIPEPAFMVNQTLPSGPGMMSPGETFGPALATSSLTAPAGVLRPILPICDSVNQRLPSAPVVMRSGNAPAVGTTNSVILGCGPVQGGGSTWHW